jgi:hypothetical protein
MLPIKKACKTAPAGLQDIARKIPVSNKLATFNRSILKETQIYF